MVKKNENKIKSHSAKTASYSFLTKGKPKIVDYRRKAEIKSVT